MSVQNSYPDAIPVELLQNPTADLSLRDAPQDSTTSTGANSQFDEQTRAYVIAWRNQLRTQRIEKLNIWNECWALYRGQADFTNKEDWQSQIVMPKAWGTVKQAVNVIKRFLNSEKLPWSIGMSNSGDPLGAVRAEKMTDITKVFMEKAHFVEEISTGLETGFIMGLGVWKVGWWLHPRTRMSVQTKMVPAQSSPMMPQQQDGSGVSLPQQPPWDMSAAQPLGGAVGDLQRQQKQQYPTMLPGQVGLGPGGLTAPGSPEPGMFPMMVPVKQTVREEILEGRLFILAVDPYNFYWLPGSKLNRWTGTIEDLEVPKWQLMEMAEAGAFDPKVIEKIGPMKIDEYQKQSWLRFGELPRATNGPSTETSIVKLTEFYGPLIIDGKIVEPHAHVLIANDSWVIYNSKNDKWHQKAPYCAFSPLQLPFRTEGVGLVEMVRSIDRALDQIVNLGVDTLLFRLMPLFEFTPDVYENPEDLRTGLTPGKILRRNTLAAPGDSGLRPIQFQDVSPGAAQMSGILDRAHQEGGLVSELQQSLPRWSGAQTATETQAIQQNQSSFFGAMAADIEKHAIAPIIEMSLDTIMQYIDTANDPRIGKILGMGQEVLAGMSQPEILEMIQGDYDIKVQGLTDQLQKAEMLQNLVQFMNLIGQNPEAWLPYLNQDALLRRILEAFQPSIHDLSDIMATPQQVAASKEEMAQQKAQQQQLAMIPELARMAHETSLQKEKLSQEQAQTESDNEARVADQAIAHASNARKETK